MAVGTASVGKPIKTWRNNVLSQIRYFRRSVIPNCGNGDSGNHGGFLGFEYYKIISNTELASFDGDVIKVVYVH